MPIDTFRISHQIALLEVIDGRRMAIDASAYLRAALDLREVIHSQLSDLPIRAFLNHGLPSVETTAENVFFDRHRRFADVDGSGNADVAQEVTNGLVQRLRHR
jgi:hypothetical protein